MNNHRYCVIMADGSGNRSQYALTYNRFQGVVPDENILVVTLAKYADEARKALPMLPPENILREPFARKTAPCMALVLFSAAQVTLDGEYKRDLRKNLPIEKPVNYYPEDDPSRPPRVSCTCSTEAGRGPTMLMSPIRMFKSCGSSSMKRPSDGRPPQSENLHGKALTGACRGIYPHR